MLTDLSSNTIDELNLAGFKKMAERVRRGEFVPALPEQDLTEFMLDVDPGTRILDLACGWGHFAPHFTDAGFDYLGLDYSPDMIALARDLHPDHEFKLGSYHDLLTESGCAENSLGGIWANAIFGCDPKKSVPGVLRQMRRLLMPGGVAHFRLYDLEEEHDGIVEGTLGQIYLAVWRYDRFLSALLDAGFSLYHHYREPSDCSMTFLAYRAT